MYIVVSTYWSQNKGIDMAEQRYLHGRRPAGVLLGVHRCLSPAVLATRKTRKRVAASLAGGSCKLGFRIAFFLLRLLVLDSHGGNVCSSSVGGNDNDGWDHGSIVAEYYCNEFCLLRFGFVRSRSSDIS
jgi:hypothetical protein